MTGSMHAKRGLIMGVANERSIAWGIAKAMAEAGAELAFTYQGEAFGKRLEPLAASVGSDFMVDVDVTDDASLDTAFEELGKRWDTIDFVVHAIAYSDKNELTGRILNTSRENFKNSMDISAYSLIEVARRAHPMMSENGGTILTLTYMGSTRVTPNYNVMGRPYENARRRCDWRRAQNLQTHRSKRADALKRNAGRRWRCRRLPCL